MNRFFFPLFLIILGGALFVVYTNGQYQKDKVYAASLAQYTTTLDQSEQLRGARDQLLSERNAIPEDDQNKLMLLLPSNVDNIRLIIDINDIAARYNLQVEGISLGGTGNSSAGSASSIGSNAGPVGQVTIGFTVQASYDEFTAFLEALERSLRLIDVSHISFTTGSTGDDTYQLTVTTYWLK
ncbi:MAG: hypothetical protein ACREGH_03675 [Minisyncoccia bacterium]